MAMFAISKLPLVPSAATRNLVSDSNAIAF
jgi:hypothetical protein